MWLEGVTCCVRRTGCHMHVLFTLLSPPADVSTQAEAPPRPHMWTRNQCSQTLHGPNVMEKSLTSSCSFSISTLSSLQTSFLTFLLPAHSLCATHNEHNIVRIAQGCRSGPEPSVHLRCRCNFFIRVCDLLYLSNSLPSEKAERSSFSQIQHVYWTAPVKTLLTNIRLSYIRLILCPTYTVILVSPWFGKNGAIETLQLVLQQQNKISYCCQPVSRQANVTQISWLHF